MVTVEKGKYDGDQLTGVASKNAKYHPLFITMCPTYAFIDRADGRFNRAMDFKKDYSALIAAAWDIDTVYDSYLTNPEAEVYNIMQQMGLDEVTNDLARDKRKHMFDLLASGQITGKFRDRFMDPFGEALGKVT